MIGLIRSGQEIQELLVALIPALLASVFVQRLGLGVIVLGKALIEDIGGQQLGAAVGRMLADNAPQLDFIVGVGQHQPPQGLGDLELGVERLSVEDALRIVRPP